MLYEVYARYKNTSSNHRFESNKSKQEFAKELTEYYKLDDDFVNLSVIESSTNSIDYNLSARMSAIRDICELGHKVRANAVIKNRQPLRKAFITIIDQDIQDYMIYVDCSKEQFADIIRKELNVFEVEFTEPETEVKLFNFNMKPNFRTLGPKGFGKLAQGLKNHIQNMQVGERNTIYHSLKSGNTETILNIPLTFADVEIEKVSKENYVSASSRHASIILDINLDETLIELGFIAEFRSSIQNIRKDNNMDITDRIELSILAEDNNAATIAKFDWKLKRDLLATEINMNLKSDDLKDAHEITIGKDKLFVKVFLLKEGNA